MERLVERRFFDVRELATYLSLSEDTIRAWVKLGKIPFSKFGRSVRFDLNKIETWCKQKECRYTNKSEN